MNLDMGIRGCPEPVQDIVELIMAGFPYHGFRISVPQRLYELPQKCERRQGHGCVKRMMLEREITNEIGGGKGIYPSIHYCVEGMGKEKKICGFFKRVIRRSRPLAMSDLGTPLSFNLRGQCQKGSRSKIMWAVHDG